MPDQRLRWWAIGCLGGLVGWAGIPVQARAGEPLTIRIYDAVGVRAGEMQTARRTGSRILEDAGFAVIWLDCTTPRPSNVLGPCDVPLSPRELVVRMTPAAARNSPSVLGEALVDLERGYGVLATVFADRVQAVADQANTSVGRLLGRAVVHEVGHLLLGSTQHVDRGLMRGEWRTSEIRNDRPWEWRLAGGEASRMRRELVARARSADAVLSDLRGVPLDAGLDGASDGRLELLDVLWP